MLGGHPFGDLTAVEVLILDLFTGIDGLGYAIDSVVGARAQRPSLTLMFERDPFCRQVLSDRRCRGRQDRFVAPWKDAEGLEGSVFALAVSDFGLLAEMVAAMPALKRVAVVGGSPCVGFSAANSARRGVDDPASMAMWIIPVLVTRLRSLLTDRRASVGFVLENVQMEPAHKQGVTKTMGLEPVLIDAASLCAAARPRLFWSNYHVKPPPKKDVSATSALDSGWAPAPAKRFRTFLRPFPPGRPTEFPAKYWRMPLSCYDDRGLVYRPLAAAADLNKATSMLRDSMAAKTDELRRPGSDAIKVRGGLAEWIHQQGGHGTIRPLNADERERSLGFPLVEREAARTQAALMFCGKGAPPLAMPLPSQWWPWRRPTWRPSCLASARTCAPGDPKWFPPRWRCGQTFAAEERRRPQRIPRRC